MGFLYTRIYLFDPNRLLDRCKGLIRLTTGPGAFALWVIVVLAGAATALENWDALSAILRCA